MSMSEDPRLGYMLVSVVVHDDLKHRSERHDVDCG